MPVPGAMGRGDGHRSPARNAGDAGGHGSVRSCWTPPVWSTEDGRHLVDLGVMAAGVFTLAFSDDGAILTASSVAGDFMRWTTLPPTGAAASSSDP